jgi:thioredoxin 1
MAGGCAGMGGYSAYHETSTNVVRLTGTNFDARVLQSTNPVLVDFWAPWCGPCRALGPSISALADEYQGRVTVGKVNVDDETELSEKYKIDGIPAVFIFKDGKILHQLVGLREKKEFQDLLEPLLPKAPPPAN